MFVSATLWYLELLYLYDLKGFI